MLGELEGKNRIVLCDMEAGLGTLSRVHPGQVDLVLVVAEPSAKGVDVARRAAQIAATRAGVIVVANRIRDESDMAAIQDALGEYELVAVPEEPAILRADREGLAPIDVAEDAPGIQALRSLAERAVAYGSQP